MVTEAIITAIGIVAVAVAIISLETGEAQAVSCNLEIALCHGCSGTSQGFGASDSKCFHR